MCVSKSNGLISILLNEEADLYLTNQIRQLMAATSEASKKKLQKVIYLYNIGNTVTGKRKKLVDTRNDKLSPSDSENESSNIIASTKASIIVKHRQSRQS